MRKDLDGFKTLQEIFLDGEGKISKEYAKGLDKSIKKAVVKRFLNENKSMDNLTFLMYMQAIREYIKES